MPTPDETILPPSPPHDISDRSAFASCPPEDACDPHPPDDESSDDDALTGAGAETDEPEEHAIAQEPTPEPEMPHVDTYEPSGSRSRRKERTGDEEAGNVSLDGTADSESRGPSHAQARAERPPEYLSFPPSRDRLLPNTTSSFLRPGSKFHGTQQSDRQVYDVQVEIKDVDMAESFLCGYLRIQGLTDDHPTLTTFFEGEIIGPKHLFRTTHPSWGSSEKTDLAHWARFPAWRPLAKSAKTPSFTLKNYTQREHIFMRWKEYFLVPDHRVKTISGASFEGFYYICFSQVEGTVSGIYFHAKSEKFQQLELRHMRDGGCAGAVEFR